MRKTQNETLDQFKLRLTKNLKPLDHHTPERHLERITKKVRWQKNVEIVTNEKLRIGKCKDCKVIVTMENMCAFDFDHREGVEKVGDITNMLREAGPETIETEMQKCDLRCVNCHWIITRKRNKKPSHKRQRRH
jgi:hypothetical protein